MATKSKTGAFQAARFAFGISMEADRRRTLITASAQIFSAVAGVAVVLAVKAVIELVQGDGAPVSLLWPLIILTVVMSLISGSAAIRAQQERILGERVSQVIWRDVLDVVSSVDLISYEDHGFISEFSAIERESMSRPMSMTRALFSFVGGMIGTVTMIVVLVTLAPAIAPVLLLGGIPAVFLSRRASKLEFDFSRKNTPLYIRRYNLLRVLTEREFAAEVRSFGAAPHLRAQHGSLDIEFMTALRRHVRSRSLLATGQLLGSAGSLAAGLLVIVYLLDKGTLTLASAGAAAIAARILGTQLSALYGSFNGLSEALPFVDHLRTFLSRPNTSQPGAEPRQLDSAFDLVDVSFTYPQANRPALDNVSLRIGAGEVVALVGENGSGKSTLATIVSGLYRPDAGEAKWDGAPVTTDDIRASVATVFQDFGKYSFDVTNNIALAGVDSSGPGEVRRAAQDAHIDEVIERLSAGYQTSLGRDIDDGVDLSGGQWQRLALARALYKKAPLLVLDEPSAALDPRAESELFEDVRRILNGRAALLISHRFANVRLADRIYVMDSGHIIEEGTHEQLMALGGKYAELFNLQSAGYLDANH